MFVRLSRPAGCKKKTVFYFFLHIRFFFFFLCGITSIPLLLCIHYMYIFTRLTRRKAERSFCLDLWCFFFFWYEQDFFLVFFPDKINKFANGSCFVFNIVSSALAGLSKRTCACNTVNRPRKPLCKAYRRRRMRLKWKKYQYCFHLPLMILVVDDTRKTVYQFVWYAALSTVPKTSYRAKRNA